MRSGVCAENAMVELSTVGVGVRHPLLGEGCSPTSSAQAQAQLNASSAATMQLATMAAAGLSSRRTPPLATSAQAALQGMSVQCMSVGSFQRLQQQQQQQSELGAHVGLGVGMGLGLGLAAVGEQTATAALSLASPQNVYSSIPSSYSCTLPMPPAYEHSGHSAHSHSSSEQRQFAAAAAALQAQTLDAPPPAPHPQQLSPHLKRALMLGAQHMAQTQSHPGTTLSTLPSNSFVFQPAAAGVATIGPQMVRLRRAASPNQSILTVGPLMGAGALGPTTNKTSSGIISIYSLQQQQQPLTAAKVQQHQHQASISLAAGYPIYQTQPTRILVGPGAQQTPHCAPTLLSLNPGGDANVFKPVSAAPSEICDDIEPPAPLTLASFLPAPPEQCPHSNSIIINNNNNCARCTQKQAAQQQQQHVALRHSQNPNYASTSNCSSTTPTSYDYEDSELEARVRALSSLPEGEALSCTTCSPVESQAPSSVLPLSPSTLAAAAASAHSPGAPTADLEALAHLRHATRALVDSRGATLAPPTSNVILTIPPGAIPDGERVEIIFAVLNEDRDKPALSGASLSPLFPIHLSHLLLQTHALSKCFVMFVD